ncbi:50S ribosomal protein L29 [bacterium]|nr:50S ribosomal protein L29 [bacterium]
MKASDLRSMTRDELEHEINELREEEFRLRLRRPTEDLPNALRLRTIRRDIARIETLLREDKLGIIELPRKSTKEAKKEEVQPAEKKEEKPKKKTAKKTSTSKAAPKKTKKAPATKKKETKRTSKGTKK